MKGGFVFFVMSVFAILAINSTRAQAQSACLGHHPQYIDGKFEVWYTGACTGHDEPEIDPLSNRPGSAQDLTWTVVLPTDGISLVSDVGPTFWFGGTVTDPHSLLGQAFVELQFYPDAIVRKCYSNGGFSVSFAANTYTACSPVWKVVPNNSGAGGFAELAAFNAMLEDSSNPGSPLLMSAGDAVTVHYYITPAADGFHVTVSDLTTGRSGTIILNSSSDGPLMPPYSTQQLGNDLGWGLVYDTPNAFVWEIGHTSVFNGGAALCYPGQTNCDSYNASSWAGFSPLQIKSVVFGDGSSPQSYAAVSDQGGKAEVLAHCSIYGGPFCIYPWYTLGTNGYHYGVDYPDTKKDFRQADQFTTTKQCSGPFGPDTMYCATILK
jgi:hypothetical protein